jgi:hypothetical protein
MGFFKDFEKVLKRGICEDFDHFKHCFRSDSYKVTLKDQISLVVA